MFLIFRQSEPQRSYKQGSYIKKVCNIKKKRILYNSLLVIVISFQASVQISMFLEKNFLLNLLVVRTIEMYFRSSEYKTTN